MNPAIDARPWRRRARPLLGTLVEVGIGTAGVEPDAAIERAFAALLDVQRCLSRFDPGSDLSRFHALPAGESLRVRPSTRAVLAAARELQQASGGDFDISLGSAPRGWQLEGDLLTKLDAATRLDSGGIAKGHAVDCAVLALQGAGCTAGWVNAGGDLRAFGDIDVPVQLRDEVHGGTRPFASVRQAAFATSHFAAGSRDRLAGRGPARDLRAHVSVAAPLCLWADALTKIVALRGCAADPLLARYGASAWQH